MKYKNVSHGDVQWNDNRIVLPRQTFHQHNIFSHKTANRKTKSVIASAYGGAKLLLTVVRSHIRHPIPLISRRTRYS
jgi:hypothetical protein